MAKSKKTAKIPPNQLPQNIVAFGERVEENKNIYIEQKVYNQIHRFTKNKTVNESGGVLVGEVINELGKTNIVISGFIEAKFSEGTPTTLTFTHRSWEHIHSEMDKKHKGKKILGWIHTHPNFGIFLSEYDKFIHQNFFGEEHQIAYVIDPVRHIEGFYFWINGNIERCKGYYVFDRTGKKITVAPTASDDGVTGYEAKTNIASNVIIAILAVAVVVLAVMVGSLSTKIDKLDALLKDVDILKAKQDALEGFVGVDIRVPGEEFDNIVIPPVENPTNEGGNINE